MEFGALRVDVLGEGEVEAWRTFRGNEWGNKGEKMVVSREGEGECVRVEGLRALGGKEYFIQRQGCKFCSILFHVSSFLSIIYIPILFPNPVFSTLLIYATLSRHATKKILTLNPVSPLSLLKNPMILIAGVSMIVVFGMPYLMDNMDPEMRAEFEEAQKSSPMAGLLGGGVAKGGAQGFDAAGWLAGQGKGKDGGSPGAAGAIKR